MFDAQSAVPDRREFRRRCCDCRDAGPEPQCEIEFLLALPKAWPSGSVTGLRARGGFEVDLAWKDGRLTSSTVRSTAGTAVRLRYGAAVKNVQLRQEQSLTWNGS
jgi:alpha-L-fucosidase 2